MSELVIHPRIPNPRKYACEILRKIQKLGQSACVLFDDKVEMESFNNLLWEFDSRSFIPHGVAATKEASEGAFVLSNNIDQLPDAQNLILLCHQVHPRFYENMNRFPRILDIVAHDDPELTEGRNRFKQYRKLGIQPITK
ncbi:MAG: DNA polymerase III subunit chi [Burkholderiales bacterium]|nr:DNA polymerase III subunit chi [Burkholderiales bacterium]